MGKQGHNKQKRTGLKTSKPSQTEVPPLTEPSSFSSFAELADHASSMTYIIARAREIEDGKVLITTLGTGFLVGPNRMMTCAHVMSSDENTHEDSDVYVFIQRNHPYWHKTFIQLELNETLFLDPERDNAILYLPDSFYKMPDGSLLKDPNEHLHLSRAIPKLATEVGVLGYPMQQILYNDDLTDVNVESVVLRADQGIVNATYISNEGIAINEFTMGFNPGNSGGPIMDIKSGLVLAMVHGFNSVPVVAVKEKIDAEQIRGNEPTETGQVDVISTIRALYSNGLSSLNYLDYESKHGVSFR